MIVERSLDVEAALSIPDQGSSCLTYIQNCPKLAAEIWRRIKMEFTVEVSDRHARPILKAARDPVSGRPAQLIQT